MTMVLKALAKELKCPVMLLHQLNRAVEGRENKRPGLSDLRDSGSVEQDADVVMFIYRAEYYLRQEEPKEGMAGESQKKNLEKCKNVAEVIVAKNRQGEMRTVNVRFDGDRQLFENLTAGDAAN